MARWWEAGGARWWRGGGRGLRGAVVAQWWPRPEGRGGGAVVGGRRGALARWWRSAGRRGAVVEEQGFAVADVAGGDREFVEFGDLGERGDT